MVWLKENQEDTQFPNPAPLPADEAFSLLIKQS
jgi:hypothetical protein